MTAVVWRAQGAPAYVPAAPVTEAVRPSIVDGIHYEGQALKESIRDYATLLTTLPAYSEAMAVRHDPILFVEELEGVYATDPMIMTTFTPQLLQMCRCVDCQ